MRSRRLTFLTLLLIWLLLGSTRISGAEQSATNLHRPRLAVVIVIDQMRYDYLTRFAGVFSGGFKRLLDQGMVFTNAQHDHALTETGVGHATISTGCYPSHHGIVSNQWWDRATRKSYYCVEDSAAGILDQPDSDGRSPARLLRPGLTDWLKRASPQSKVFSVAMKDRSAILMGAVGPNAAYWYSTKSGRFVTSIRYIPVYPQWADLFNNAQQIDKHYADGIWSKSQPEETYFLAREDSFPAEYDGIHVTFPHNFAPSIGEPHTKLYEEFCYTPFIDQLTLAFARNLASSERLGVDSIPDLLWISCSAADYVGHRYGPLSQEELDYYLRVDGYLDKFFTFLDSTVGTNQYAVALTSDHGVLPMPEELQRRGIPAGRINSDTLTAAIEGVGAAVASELGLKGNVIANCDEGIFLNYTEAEAKDISKSQLRDIVADKVRHLSSIADVYTADELEASGGNPRPYLDQYRKNYNPDRSPDLMLRYREFWIISNAPHGTSHGTCYSYDTHVPLIFWGAGIMAGRQGQKVATVDIAPTMAELLGVTPPTNIDGRSLAPLLTH